ncbi:MAG: AraC family transcriptional regulator [Rhizobiaceae bacterium]
MSNVLRTVRLAGSLQFCFAPSGNWQTDGKPRLAALGKSSSTVPFHIVVEGACWLRMGAIETELCAGDVVAFPFGTGHQLGAGDTGILVTPVADLPPKPWRELPIMRYGDGSRQVRLLCGYLQCDALNFSPLRQAMPELLHARTTEAEGSAWLRATIAQIVAEADRPRSGGLSMLERLTEIIFIELLRHYMSEMRSGQGGWLAALADPALSRCLAVIHQDSSRDWSVADLSATSGLSRTALTDRFETVLGTSPMRYVRDWRLYLASAELMATTKPIAAIADEAGYGTEAAFNRAFSRAYGAPPAAWRQNARRR